ncbi:hypothetical protein V6N13_110768 [Hibiscus sabdariffa]|uniref:Uncharacterized protein n=1 Tax=Hibiscus sabdariffa TaxID=183260 RepID=A0ABR2TIT8_9ROSI
MDAHRQKEMDVKAIAQVEEKKGNWSSSIRRKRRCGRLLSESNLDLCCYLKVVEDEVGFDIYNHSYESWEDACKGLIPYVQRQVAGEPSTPVEETADTEPRNPPLTQLFVQ